MDPITDIVERRDSFGVLARVRFNYRGRVVTAEVEGGPVSSSLAGAPPTDPYWTFTFDGVTRGAGFDFDAEDTGASVAERIVRSGLLEPGKLPER